MSAPPCKSKNSNADALRGLKSRRRCALVVLHGQRVSPAPGKNVQPCSAPYAVRFYLPDKFKSSATLLSGSTTLAAPRQSWALFARVVVPGGQLRSNDAIGQRNGWRVAEVAWAKLDDGLTFHGKVIEAGNAAMGVWVRGLAWSAYYLTDGFVPNKVARLVAGESRGALKALVCSRLWLECPGGYRIHDYLKYNPSKAEVLEKREKDRLRKLGISGETPGGVATASNPPDPDPDPDPLDREIEAPGIPIHTIEQLGFKRLGQLGGASIVAIRQLMPITKAEMEDALKTPARGWKYLAKVIISQREQAANQPPEGSEWEAARAKEDKRNKKRRPPAEPKPPYHQLADPSKYDP